MKTGYQWQLKFVLIIAVFSVASSAQSPGSSAVTSTQSDAAALAIASRCVQASGLSSIGAFSNMMATGDVHHYWAGADVQGTATLFAKGPDQFRFDSKLSNGTQSWVVNGTNGQLQTVEGRIVALPSAGLLISRNPVAPFLELAAAMTDTSSVIRYVDSVSTSMGTADRILVQKSNPDFPAGGTVSKLYYVDRSSALLVETDEMLDSTLAAQDKPVRRLTYSGFGTFGGITLATQIREQIAGQNTWVLRLTSVAVNSGVSSDLFKF